MKLLAHSVRARLRKIAREHSFARLVRELGQLIQSTLFASELRFEDAAGPFHSQSNEAWFFHTPGLKMVGNKVNVREAEALVSQLLACLKDPRYDGKTFGVISLVGSRQAQQIESLLLNRVTAEEWSTRELRCGESRGTYRRHV